MTDRINVVCPMCETLIHSFDMDVSPTPLHTENGPQEVHRSCMLREVIGGIGHLIAHEYWCLQKHDPDAGLTFGQSAKLVAAYVDTVGIPEGESSE